MSEDSGATSVASGQASWNPAFRPNSDQEEVPFHHERGAESVREDSLQHQSRESVAEKGSAPQTSSKSQPRHFAQSASIHHLSEPEDGDLSPAQDTNAFGDLPKQGIDYTNSFPIVRDNSEGQHQSDASVPAPLASPQAEDLIANHEEEVEATHSHDGAFVAPSEANGGEGWGNDEDDFFGGTGGHDQTTTMEDDTRFSEGLPLVQHDETAKEALQKEVEWGELDVEDDFFGGATQSDDPPALDRKSTSEVLDSMHYPPHSDVHDDVGAWGTKAGDGLTANTTVVADTIADITGAGGGSAEPGADISAMWSEALDDDLLLDEDFAALDTEALDPSAFFEDDGEGFLEDTSDLQSQISPPAPTPVVDQAGQLKGFSAIGGPSKYAPAQTASTYLPNGYQASAPVASTPNMAFGTQPRPQASTAQSFVDKSKGGYESPYDLPMDLRPKRQAAPRQQPNTQNHRTVPPPRAGSIGAPSPQTPAGLPTPSLGPPGASKAAPAKPGSVSHKASGFFEELPIASRPPRPSSAARFTSAPQSKGPPSNHAQSSPPKSSAPNSSTPVDAGYGLVMPQRQLSFGEEPTGQQPAAQAPPKATSRYSPSPASQSAQPNAPPPQGRYSSTPGSGPPPASLPRASSTGYAAPFQPRTSSPLARSTSISDESGLPKNAATLAAFNGLQRGISTPEMSPTSPGMMQSPEKAQSATRSSFSGITQPPNTSSSNNAQQTGTVRRRHAPSVVKEYISPVDDRAQDPLQRWKGGPIFKFGAGGLVSSFPVETPRFSVGHVQPLYIVSPGEVKIRIAKQVTSLEESLASFPGPLKAKGKKKDLLVWLNKRVDILKSQAPNDPSEIAQYRQDERVLLLRVLAILVENDGNLEASSATNAIRDILIPPPPPVDPHIGGASYGSEFAHGITRSATVQPKTHTVEVNDVEEVRKLLLKGEREKAAWLAVDKNLWGHAMLISSTIQGETWKQVVHEFVRSEVKTVGNNTEALSALYDVFSGNWEESVDQLVPTSARSGFQMVSKSGSASSQNALAGLDRWQETLALIVGNRTAGDAKALVSLGELLANYGRAEAAHLCYIIAKVPGIFSGLEDPQAHAVLLGANHRQQNADIHRDTEAILLTEVYEFAVNVLAGGNNSVPMTHLAPYKLQHAYVLADAGHRDEAQQYCEAITTSLKANKTAPYLHAQFVSSLDDLVNRLSQTPREPSKSWLGNPKMGNVSSSLLSSFSKFVAGDDDNASTTSGPSAEAGPFGAISGEPISLSRSGSPAIPGAGWGQQNGYNTGLPPAGGGSRYAPTGSYSSSPSGSYTAMQHRDSSGSLPRMSPDHFRKNPTSAYQPQGAYTPTSGLAHAESYTSEAARSIPSVIAPSQGALDSSPFDSRPGTSDGPPGAVRASGRRPSYEPLSVPKPQRDRNSSAYQPRSNGQESRGSSAYAPRSGSYAPRSYAPSPAASERLLPESSPDTSSSYIPQAPAAQEPITSPIVEQAAEQNAEQDASASEETQPAVEAPISFGYDPTPSYGYEAPQPALAEEPAAQEHAQPSYGYQPFEPSTSGVDDANSGAGGYEPSSSSYAPPSYQPYQPDANGDEPDSPIKPKKKGIMDLDDDDAFGASAAQLKKEEKARKDREAEEAFRKAAEADAARDTKGSAGQKKGWFGGWLGGPKKEQDKSLEPTVHKAKLGDESSFVYDETLKKWINKKAGPEEATSRTATPPPPRAGPPSRAASAMGPPRTSAPTSLPSSNSVPGSRNVSPLVNMKGQDEAGATAGSPLGTPPLKPSPGMPPVGGGLAPPSRPGTGMSGASSTANAGDDILGSLGPRKGAAGKKGKKGGRYVDVMAK